jgi:type I restriction enzyme S subunit
MARLRDLGQWSGGNTPSKANPTYWTDGSIPWVSPKDMKVDEITSSEDRVSEAALAEGRVSLLPEGSVLVVTRSGILSHTLPVAVTKTPVTINQDLKALIPKQGVLPKYVALALRGASRRILKECSKHGTTVASIETNALLDFEIPLVDLDEQRRIVDEIEKQFSRLDEAIANLKRVKANLKRYKAAVLKSAVDGSLMPGVDAAAWKWQRVEQVATVISGLTKNPKRQQLTRKLPYLRVANVYANELRLDDIEEIGVADDEIEKLLVKRGDLLVVEGNGSADQIGRVALWDGSIPNCVHQNHLIKVRFGENVLPEWAMIWLLSPGGRHEIERASSSTSGLYTLSTGKVGRLPIPVPARDKQHRIVAEVDRRMSIVREAEAELDANLKRANVLRQSVLSRTFGEGLTTHRRMAALTEHWVG